MEDILAILFCCLVCCDEDAPIYNNYDNDNDTKLKKNN